MKMSKAFLAVIAAIVLTSSMWGQHNHSQATPQTKPNTSEDAVAACQQHMSEAKDSLGKLDIATANAESAKTAEERRTALAEVRVLVDQLKKHISMCPMMQAESMPKMEGMKCMGKDRSKESKNN